MEIRGKEWEFLVLAIVLLTENSHCTVPSTWQKGSTVCKHSERWKVDL